MAKHHKAPAILFRSKFRRRHTQSCVITSSIKISICPSISKYPTQQNNIHRLAMNIHMSKFVNVPQTTHEWWLSWAASSNIFGQSPYPFLQQYPPQKSHFPPLFPHSYQQSLLAFEGLADLHVSRRNSKWIVTTTVKFKVIIMSAAWGLNQRNFEYISPFHRSSFSLKFLFFLQL